MSDFTLHILHLLLLSLDYKDLHNSKTLVSKCQPRIYVDIPSPQSVYDIIPSCVDIIKIGKTNSLPLTTESSPQLKLILSQLHNYPKGASFCFKGVKGVDDKD